MMQFVLSLLLFLSCSALRLHSNDVRSLDPNSKELVKGGGEYPTLGGGEAVVLYAWYDVPHEKENLRFFLAHAVHAQINRNIDFVFVDTTPGGSSIPVPDNLPNVFWVRRENFGYDMCSWKTALDMLSPKQYKYFVLMNGSVRGPFSKKLHQGADENFLKPFTRLLGDQVRMAGTSVNCAKKNDNALHLQSMFLVTDSEGIQVVNETLSCVQKNKGLSTWGEHGEVAISQQMLKHGFGLAALQLYWRGHDFLDTLKTTSRCDAFQQHSASHLHGDPFYPNSDVDPVTFEKRNLDPEELVMFKSTRHVNDTRMEEITREYDQMLAMSDSAMRASVIDVTQ